MEILFIVGGCEHQRMYFSTTGPSPNKEKIESSGLHSNGPVLKADLGFLLRGRGSFLSREPCFLMPDG